MLLLGQPQPHRCPSQSENVGHNFYAQCLVQSFGPRYVLCTRSLVSHCGGGGGGGPEPGAKDSHLPLHPSTTDIEYVLCVALSQGCDSAKQGEGQEKIVTALYLTTVLFFRKCLRSMRCFLRNRHGSLPLFPCTASVRSAERSTLQSTHGCNFH